MKRKIIGFLVCTLLIPTMLPIAVSSDYSSNNIIYVDDDGTADYTSIQDAIDNANNGDVIIVHEGVYFENIEITKPIKLIGINREKTIIDGGKEGITITILADNVELIGFTVRNSNESGIIVESSHNTISDNIVTGNEETGICIDYIEESIFSNGFNIISKNIITLNGWNSIRLDGVDNYIELNQITFNDVHGIAVGITFKNMIRWNIITNNRYSGVDLFYSCKTTIFQNHIANNGYGVRLYPGFDNKIISNNIFENGQNANIIIYVTIFSPFKDVLIKYFQNYGFGKLKNTWDGNYWNDSSYPYVISGLLNYFDHIFSKDFEERPFCNFDWHPAKEPYDIPIEEGTL